MAQQARNIMSSNDGILAPHIKRRRPLSFAVVFSMIIFGVSLTAFSLLVSHAPFASSTSFGDAFGIGAKVIAWALTAGKLWPSFVPQTLAGIAASPIALAIEVKAIVSIAIGGFLAWHAAKGALVPRDEYEHVRGAMLYRDKEAFNALKSKLAPGKEPYFVPGVTVGRAELGNGCLCFGSPGSGKTSIWLPQIKASLDRDEFFMSLDVKKEQIQKLGDKVHFLGPWLRGSLILDIGSDLTTFAQAEAFANNLIRVDPTDAKGKVWQSAANAVFSCLVKKLVKDKPLAWTWRDLSNLLDQDVASWLEIVREIDESQAKILDVAETTQSGIVFNLATELRNLKVIADLFVESEKFGGKRFSIREWMTNNNYEYKGVVLVFDRENSAAVGFLIPFVLDYIGQMISGLKNDTSHPRTFYLDELPQLAPVGSLREFYEVGRSKGLMAVVSCQDFSQLELSYGKMVAEVLYSNASIKIIAKTTASQAQRKLAESFGLRDVSYKSVSQSTNGGGGSMSSSMSIQDKSVPVILPGQLGTELGPVGRVSDGKGGFRPKAIRALLAPMSGDLYMLDWPIIPMSEIRKEPKPLPSQHKLTNFVRLFMRKKGLTLGERIAAARQGLKDKELTMTDFDLLTLLYSDGNLDAARFAKCKTVGFDKFISLLADEPATAETGSVEMIEEDELEIEVMNGVETKTQTEQADFQRQAQGEANKWLETVLGPKPVKAIDAKFRAGEVGERTSHPASLERAHTDQTRGD
jgi:hypothetical protein